MSGVEGAGGASSKRGRIWSVDLLVIENEERDWGEGKRGGGEERVRGRVLDLETYEQVADSGTGDRITGSIESDSCG